MATLLCSTLVLSVDSSERRECACGFLFRNNEGRMPKVLNQATEAKAIAGTDNQDFMTPLRTKQQFDKQTEGIAGIEIIEQSADSGGLWGPMDGGMIDFIGDIGYLYGGWYGADYNDDWDSGVVTNLVYKTEDFGVTWELIRSHDLTPDATHFPPGHFCAHTKHTVNGTEYIYLLTGDPFVMHGEVRRTVDGITWNKVNVVTPAYGENLVLAAAGSLDGVLFLAGGHVTPGGTDDLVLATATNVVWKSTDNGLTWTSMGAAPWSPRQPQDRLVEHDGKLWVIGGGRYDNNNGIRDFKNDVWSFDGTTWTEVLPNGQAPWAGRFYANVVSFDGWIYLLRGNNNVSNNLSDCWRSRDGVNWDRIELGLVKSHADGCAAHPTQGIMVASGNGYLVSGATNADSPTYLISRLGGTNLASGVVGLATMQAQVVKQDKEIPVSASGVTIDSGSNDYTCIITVDNNSAQTKFINNYPGTFEYGGWEFRNGSGGTLKATIQGDGIFTGLGMKVDGAAGYSLTVTHDQGLAETRFHNNYPGDLTYGGWEFKNGGSGGTRRMFLHGNGQIDVHGAIWSKQTTDAVPSQVGTVLHTSDGGGGTSLTQLKVDDVSVLRLTAASGAKFVTRLSVESNTYPGSLTRIEYDENYADAKFINTDAGGEDYGAFHWSTNMGATNRMTLKGSGRLVLTNMLTCKSYTVATVPLATIAAGSQIYVSDESGGGVLVFSDGTNWRRVTDRAVIS